MRHRDTVYRYVLIERYAQRRFLFPELGGVGDPRTEAFRRSYERVVLCIVFEVCYATAMSHDDRLNFVDTVLDDFKRPETEKVRDV